MQNIEKTNECQACLNRRSAFLCVLLFLCSSVSDSINPLKLHSARDTSSLARIRDLISIIAQCQREHLQTIIIRFLVLARNDSMGAIVVTLQKTFVHINKRRRRLWHRRCQTLKCQTNVKLAWTDVCLFYVLFCSYVLLSKQGMHPLKQHNVRDTSSLARTRDLIFMCSTLPARISATIIIRFLVPARNDCLGIFSK